MKKSPAKITHEIGGAVEAALTYSEFGWEPLILPFKGKSPRGKWKEPRVWTPEDFASEYESNVNSASYFEKARILCYSPSSLRVKSGKRSGRILYCGPDVENWLLDQLCEPKGGANV